MDHRVRHDAVLCHATIPHQSDVRAQTAMLAKLHPTTETIPTTITALVRVDDHLCAQRDSLHASADGNHRACELMTNNQLLWCRKMSINKMKVGATDASVAYLDHDMMF